MLGLMFSLAYAAYLVLVKSVSGEMAYLSATGFLYGWYIFWTIILSIIAGVIALILPMIGAAAGASKDGKVGAVTGMILGGGASLFLLFFFALRRILYVGGAYLLHAALTINLDGSGNWNKTKLIPGGLLLLVALISRKSGSSRSSSSRKKSSNE